SESRVRRFIGGSSRATSAMYPSAPALRPRACPEATMSRQRPRRSPVSSPRIALVTGAGRGIGAATARLLAERGHDVAVNYARDTAAAEGVAADVRARGRRALLVRADVADEAAVLAMFDAVDKGLGRLTALVNNAGIVDMKARLDEMS